MIKLKHKIGYKMICKFTFISHISLNLRLPTLVDSVGYRLIKMSINLCFSLVYYNLDAKKEMQNV